MTNTENNVAAQAGDFDPAPKYEYSLDGKTVKWTNRDRMPKVAAQAGDEPMRAVLALAYKWHDEAVMAGFSGSEESQELFELLGWPDRNAAGSTLRDDDTVPVPKNALQAEGMMKLGLAWLQHNAPERLTEAGRAVSPCATADVERVDMILHCPRCHTQHIDAPGDGWTNPL